MTRILQIALGILAAIGGFVDIGDIVFTTTAGASFGYQVLWITALGAVGITFYAEMCGRVAAVSKRPVFDAVRNRFGFGAGLATLASSVLVSLLTCIAEVGGIALVLQLLTGTLYRPLVIAGAVAVALAIWVLPFVWIERIFGFGGLLLITFTVAALELGPDWGRLAYGFVPHIEGTHSYLIWMYTAVGLFSATLMPYEVYFYSSGAVEDGWTTADLRTNKLTAIVGYGLGAFLSFSLVIVSAELFLPRGVAPELLGTVGLAALDPLGTIGLLLGLIGILFAVSGAAIDTALAGAYSIAQFFGWPWGRYHRPKRAGRFTFAWLAFLLIAMLVAVTGVNPILVTEYSVIFGVIAMPLTFLPVLLVARDKEFMGEYASGRIATAIGWFYLCLIAVIALSAVPLLVLTNMGQG